MAGDRGGFIWYELITDDIDAARTFYRNVVGWEIAAAGMPTPNGSYHMIVRSDGGNAGGVLAIQASEGTPAGQPVWLGYIQHPDVDAAVRTVTDAGGAVHMPAMDMPGVGRMAMVADPQGAVYYIMNPTPPSPDAVSDVFSVTEAQRVRWNELQTKDPQSAVALYSNLFGWRQEGAMPMGDLGDYLFVQHDDVAIGAIMPEMPQGGTTAWTYYIGVDDIDRAAAAVIDSGGTLFADPQEIPGGEFAVNGSDPSGAVFGLVGPRKEK